MKILFLNGISFTKKQIEVENIPISSLAPKILTDEKDIEKIKPYLNSLSKTINAKGITNIALTGGYGSGKSTIIKTFQNLNPQHEYLNISLASFNEVKGEDGKTRIKKDELERLLEVSILQQIFYHVKPSEIPDSRFKRIINVTDKKILFISLVLIFWVLSTLILFKFNYIDKINPITWKIKDQLDIVTIISVLIFFTGIGLFSKSVIRLFSNSKINKFNIKGELELGDNLDKSVFNEHIEEIIYFFERTKYDVVVIEDLDRFESTDIFTKLREINILLNNSKLIIREINFLYAIKDEMFKEKSERVKFFEYIIPVIPFINPSTAGDQLTKMIKESGLEGVLSKDFTEDVVTFIDDIDMRLLINIFHEYQLYKQNLISDLDQDSLFAIIAYKNLFPDDFGDLQKRKGKLYQFLSKKESYIKLLTDKIQKEIIVKEFEVIKINGEEVEKINELRAIYINTIHNLIPDISTILINSNKITFKDLMNEDNFENLQNISDIQYNRLIYNNSYGMYSENRRASGVSFSTIENTVNSEFSYNERVGLIKNKLQNKTENLQFEIEKLKIKKREIDSWKLIQIFEEIDINLHLNGFSENELIRNLLLNGYINENYNDYISLFHEVNLTKEDYTFERKVKSGIHSPFDFGLTKIENLTKKIPEKYFKRDSILNFDLLDYLSENYVQYEKQYDSIIGILSNEKTRSLDFIDSYINQREKNSNLFIKSIYKSWEEFWDYIYLKSNYTDEKTIYYLKHIINFADLEDIVLNKSSSNIATYIMNQSDFLTLMKDIKDSNKIKKIVETLNIKFASLDSSTEESKDLFDYVYENNHYQISAKNIALMLKEKGTNISPEKLNNANYSTILDSDCQPLIDYINENIFDYVKNVFLKIPENISESKEVVIQLLNNSKDLNDHLKLEIIKKQIAKIDELSLIKDLKIKEMLIQNNKVISNWNNIYNYYELLEPKELDETLINFFNKDLNYNTLSNISLKQDNKKTEEFITTFSIKLIYCNDLSLDSYVNLIKKVPYTWGSLSFENLDYDKIEWMVIEKKILSLSTKNFNKLKEHFSDLHITLIENNQNIFLIKFDQYSLDKKDILLLLNSGTITNKNKVELIQKTDDNIIIEDNEIGKIVCFILAISSYIPLEYKVLESLFKHSNSIENRIKLLNKHIDKITNAQIQNLIELLGHDYPEVFKKQHKPKFPNTSYHVELFKNLAINKQIIKQEVDKKDANQIRVFANY